VGERILVVECLSLPMSVTYYSDTAPKLAFSGFAQLASRNHSCDVLIIGGGFTGLGTALTLSGNGLDVIVIEAGKLASGASGRNGGQIHIGQRQDPMSLEAQYGHDQARALWDLSMDARSHLDELILSHHIDCDQREGLIHAWHKPKFAREDQAYKEFVERRYSYEGLTLLDKDKTAEALGTDVYFGALRDAKGGHLHPLKLALGLAKAAQENGVLIVEDVRAHGFERRSDHVHIELEQGLIIKAKTLVLAGNGLMEGLDEDIDSRLLSINNFILTTEPLKDDLILTGNEAAADSRFVVNYWRKTADNRLLFGGGENYSPHFPKDIKAFVRKNMLKIYPNLKDIGISHAWGGTLAITANRAPFVRDLGGGVLVSAGYSGQGVVLAPYFGHLLAKSVLKDNSGLSILSQIKVPPLFGIKALRKPAMVAGLSYYALLDKWG